MRDIYIYIDNIVLYIYICTSNIGILWKDLIAKDWKELLLWCSDLWSWTASNGPFQGTWWPASLCRRTVHPCIQGNLVPSFWGKGWSRALPILVFCFQNLKFWSRPGLLFEMVNKYVRGVSDWEYRNGLLFEWHPVVLGAANFWVSSTSKVGLVLGHQDGWDFLRAGAAVKHFFTLGDFEHQNLRDDPFSAQKRGTVDTRMSWWTCWGGNRHHGLHHNSLQPRCELWVGSDFSVSIANVVESG